MCIGLISYGVVIGSNGSSSVEGSKRDVEQQRLSCKETVIPPPSLSH